MQKSRYLRPFIEEFLPEKMAWIGGPRQVGKTTLALSLLKKGSPEHPAYFNWDFPGTRSLLLKGEIPNGEPRIVLDEIHKYARWRNLVKGLFDRYRERASFIVTGSARLDLFSRGGDSLLGRYFHYRLHPWTLGELPYDKESTSALLRYGGFPEPLFKSSERFHRLWQKERVHRVIREDIRDLERIREISLLELLVEALIPRASSILSKNSLGEDLSLSPHTVENWITILERMYLVYRVSPFGAPRIKAVKKEQKLYFWDWSMCENDGARFENLVASHLLKYCHFLEDTEGRKVELRFIRDTEKREIDFVVIEGKKPLFAVECKNDAERNRSPYFDYFKARIPIPELYQVHLGKRDFGDEKKEGRVLPFHVFCKERLNFGPSRPT